MSRKVRQKRPAPKRQPPRNRQRTSAGPDTELVWYEAHSRSREGDNDGLGLDQLADEIAAWFWPGFTPRTTRCGYFVVTLYGLHIARKTASHFGALRDDDMTRLLFSRFERLWGLSQFVASSGNVDFDCGMLGVHGIGRAFSAAKGGWPVDFNYLRQSDIGALGAYLATLRTHQLVAPERLRVTPLGWEIAQWMWDQPNVDTSEQDEFVIRTLNPNNQKVPHRVGRTTLEALGARAPLLHLQQRPEIRDLLWTRLFVERPPPRSLGVLERMANHLRRYVKSGICEPLAILHALTTDRMASGPDALQHKASMALCFARIGRTLLEIFDRVHLVLLESGYAAAWNECVQAAVTDDSVADLNRELIQYRRLGCGDHFSALSPLGRLFAQTLQRLNTQNRYNVFETVLNLHTGSHRALGRGEGWLGRTGETMYIRHAATNPNSGNAANRWHPSFRLTSAIALLRELEQIP